MTISRFVFRALSVAALMSISACAATNPDAGPEGLDPYEETNRSIHDFNVALDRNILRPAAQGYDTVTPATFQHLIGNGLDFLELPKDMINYLLQGEVKPALRTFGRLTINAVLGIGVLDPATEFGLPKETTDFGVTLGKWGVESGPYLVVPFLGPSTTRDLGGDVVDRAFRPQTYTFLADSPALTAASISSSAVGILDTRNRNFDLIDEVLYESPDSYVTLRSIYLQRRAAMIAGEEGSDEALPDIFDEGDGSTN